MKGGSAILGMKWETEVCLCSLQSIQRHCHILFKYFQNGWHEESVQASHQQPMFITTLKNTKHGWVLTFNNMISKPNLSSLQGSFTSPDILLIRGHIFPARYSFQGTLLLCQKAEHQQYHSAPNKLLFTKPSKIFDNSCGLKASAVFYRARRTLKINLFPFTS